MFGKHALDISSLVKRAMNVDPSVYVECEKLAICHTKCYNGLVRFNNALHKADEISKEIQSDFDGDVLLHFKRLSKDSSSTPDAKRGLNFGGPSSSSDQEKLQGKVTKCRSCDSYCKPWSQPNPIWSYKSFRNFGAWLCTTKTPKPAGAMPVFRSMLLTSKVATGANLPNLESQERETSIHLTVKYPSKPVHRELKDDYAAIGKAIVYGSPQRITRVVLKNEILKKCIVEKLLQLMTLQLNELCSRRQPSMLRANTKEGLHSPILRNCALNGRKECQFSTRF